MPRLERQPLQAVRIADAAVDHCHRSLIENPSHQGGLEALGLTSTDLVRALRVGFSDGTLVDIAPPGSEFWHSLRSTGLISERGEEALKGRVVVPVPDPASGGCVAVCGIDPISQEEVFRPDPCRGVLNYQAARASDEVILVSSVLDALSFFQAGVHVAIPLHGPAGLTSDLLDLLKRERVERVLLVRSSNSASEMPRQELERAGLLVAIAELPEGVHTASELLKRQGPASLVELVHRTGERSEPSRIGPQARQEGDEILLEADGLSYRVRAYPIQLGRLRATVRADRGDAFHVDTLDLYASKSRSAFASRVVAQLGGDATGVERALLAILVEAEKATDEPETEKDGPAQIELSDGEREEALAFLRRPDLLDRVAEDIDRLGYVGERTNTRLLYLVAVSRKLEDPLSAIVLSGSGAGKSGLAEVIERLTPPEDAVLLTRLSPQSLYYMPEGFLDRKLVIVEERYGSQEADYSIRVLQSRKKLIAAAPVKDPKSGSLRTKVFSVEARAAFIEATTAASVNHENATRSFELTMDESPEQTRRVHERQRLMRTERGLSLRRQAKGITKLHWNAQRLLEPLPVVIPFADELTFPSRWMRTRRDHARFLNLIEVSAFLHQYQRERTAGAIVASTADYAVAHGLAADVLSETLSELKKPLREVCRCVDSLASDGCSVSRREIREALQVPDSTVRGWLGQLVALEFLMAERSRGGAGKSTRYRLTGRPLQGRASLGLLAPQDLASRTREGAGTREGRSRDLSG